MWSIRSLFRRNQPLGHINYIINQGILYHLIILNECKNHKIKRHIYHCRIMFSLEILSPDLGDLKQGYVFHHVTVLNFWDPLYLLLKRVMIRHKVLK